MRSIHKGYVLLIILVYLQLFALLMMANIRLLSGYKKQVREQTQLGEKRNAILSVLNDLGLQLTPECRLNAYSPAFVQKQSLSWWKTHACTHDHAGHLYYYIQVDLGTANCLGVKDANNQLKAAHFYKDVVMMGDQEMLADETIVVPDEALLACPTPAEEIQAGKRRIRW